MERNLVQTVTAAIRKEIFLLTSLKRMGFGFQSLLPREK
jgi:hypothetical protein